MIVSLVFLKLIKKKKMFRCFHFSTENLSLSFRWHNHLNPEIKKDAWTPEEEVTLIHAHQKYGNKWAEIAKFLPGRYCYDYFPCVNSIFSYFLLDIDYLFLL